MKQAFGSASVIFETDGRVRVVAGEPSHTRAKIDVTERTPISLGPSIPEPIRQLSEADIKQQMGRIPQRSREWILSIPKQPFHRREIDALEQLLRYGVGVQVRFGTIRGCGPETAQKLSIRGYVELAYEKEAPDQIKTTTLTPAGAQAIKPLKQNRG